MQTMKCIVGLGNFPEKYTRTRHNIGYRAVDLLVSKYQFEPFKTEKKFLAQIAEGEIEGERCLVAKPQTLMNLSGKSVRELQHYYKIEPQDVFVFQDDLDLPFGQVRFRQSGGSGGHNGIKSIIQHLGTEYFSRLKFGISNPQREQIPTENFVLMNFSAEEETDIPSLLEAGIDKFITHFCAPTNQTPKESN